MKFTDGFWQLRPGVQAAFAQEAYSIEASDHMITVLAPSRTIDRRGDTLNRAALDVRVSSPLPGVIGVRIDHFTGGQPPMGVDLVGAEQGHGVVETIDDGASLSSGTLTATIDRGAPWNLRFSANGKELTRSGPKSIAAMAVDESALVDPGPVEAGGRHHAQYLSAQLDLGVGGLVFGLGERFGPLVKNGQSIDIWNADGGTSSEQAYKNVPFYLTNKGYGVLVNHSGRVSFEVGSEAVERVQFSVPGERLEYFVIAGETPAEILERYTALTGRPPVVPAWSYGLWLSTSFTTDYDEATVTSFIEGMAERRLPLSVFHFDCFWMREFHWSDFTWDPRTFADPEGMLRRLHDRDLRVSVWINPYIAQRSALFAEAKEAGYLVRTPEGAVWQWNMWQAGMALVDFTNPEATAWFQSKLRALVDQGVDAFKTDFGERIPLNVVYADGSDPEQMHNRYTHLYNEAVFDVLSEARGKGEAVLFARSAAAGGQRLPVHWGGDSTSTFESMAESLRGGLSLALSGFAYWSHDIGGFEGTPDAEVFKRWLAFGMLSSHSRLHGSSSYRVPWQFDDEAVEVARRFTELKLSLMPYLWSAGLEASRRGMPVMRPMVLGYPDDPTTHYLDRQYLLGPDLLVAPVFAASGEVLFYLPRGRWTHLLTGEVVDGGTWRTEVHDALSIPLYVREGAVIPVGARSDRPDYDYLEGVVLDVYPTLEPGERTIEVESIDGRRSVFTVSWDERHVTAHSDAEQPWSLRAHGKMVHADNGRGELTW